MSKKLILHIGTEKTGTTSIQDQLYINRKLLKKNKVLYPESFKFSNHIEMAVCFQSFNPNSELYSVLGLEVNAEKVSEFKSDFLKKLNKEILDSNCDTVIISNEHLHSRIKSTVEIDEIYKWAYSIFSDVNIVVYLRQQFDLAVSHFSTTLKTGGKTTNVLPQNAEKNSYYNYYMLINLWHSKFKKIIVNRFEKKALINESVVDDFVYKNINEIQCNNLIKNKNSNKSLGAKSLSFLYHINKTEPFIKEGKINSNRRHLVRFLEEINLKDDKIHLDCKDANEFQGVFFDSNSRLSDFSIDEDVISYLNSNTTKSKNGSPLNTNYNDFSLCIELWKKSSELINFLEVRNSILKMELEILKGNFIEAKKFYQLAKNIEPNMPALIRVEELYLFNKDK